VSTVDKGAPMRKAKLRQLTYAARKPKDCLCGDFSQSATLWSVAFVLIVSVCWLIAVFESFVL
jgi:hypothetical protein